MGALFAHNSPRTQSCIHFEVVIGVVPQLLSGRVFAPFDNRERKIYSLQLTGHQIAVEIVVISWRIVSEEGKDLSANNVLPIMF